MIFQFGEYKIDVDVEKTRQFYDRAKTVSEGCQCDGCLNFERAVDKLPQNIRDFFSALGVDMKKICECYVYCAKDENTLYYGGFCHICGTLLSGKSAWKPTSDSTACWDKKQHIRSRRILAFRSATVLTCRSRIFRFQLFSSTSMRISRGCSKRGTAILTDSEAAKMSKYNALWEYVKNSGKQSLKLTFDEIQNIAGVPIDHSFLNFKKELTNYGYQVGKISMKEKSVSFEKE